MRSASLVVPVALAAAAAYAAASALQHYEARRSSAGNSVALAGMIGLLRQPLWLLGALADVLGLLLHIVALSLGPVNLVQPLQVTGLLFAIPFGGLLTGQRTHRRDLLAALCVVAGLGLFLGVARPRTTDVVLTGTSAALVGGIGVLTLGAGAALCRALSGKRRAVLMAALAGAGFAAGSVLLEDLGRLHRADGWHAVVTGPGVPALLGAVALGVVSLALSQAAFQIGTLGQALPTLTVTDPVISIALAAALLKETMTLTVAGLALDALSLSLVTTGVVWLARREGSRGEVNVDTPAVDTNLDSARTRLRSLVRPVSPATSTWWGAAGVSGSYGLLPGLVGIIAMTEADSDASTATRCLVLLASSSVCAATGVILFRRTPPYNQSATTATD